VAVSLFPNRPVPRISLAKQKKSKETTKWKCVQSNSLKICLFEEYIPSPFYQGKSHPEYLKQIRNIMTGF